MATDPLLPDDEGQALRPLAVSARDLRDLHTQIDTLAMLSPEDIPAVRILVRACVVQALRRIPRCCPEVFR